MLQIGFFCLVALLMNQLASALHLPIPGSILGVILIFFLLQTKLLKLEWIETGANWLLAEMLLFFIPSAVGILQFKDMLKVDGARMVSVIVISTLLVMACTGLVAQAIGKIKEKKSV